MRQPYCDMNNVDSLVNFESTLDEKDRQLEKDKEHEKYCSSFREISNKWCVIKEGETEPRSL